MLTVVNSEFMARAKVCINKYIDNYGIVDYRYLFFINGSSSHKHKNTRVLNIDLYIDNKRRDSSTKILKITFSKV